MESGFTKYLSIEDDLAIVELTVEESQLIENLRALLPEDRQSVMAQLEQRAKAMRLLEVYVCMRLSGIGSD